MPPETVPASPRRARRVALLLLGASLVLAAGGALWFLQFASQVRRDPALIYREPATLDQLLSGRMTPNVRGTAPRRSRRTGL